MLRFLKNWTLPIAMLIGTLAYLVFAKWSFLAPAKPYVNSFVSIITPWLIFAQLLLTFCKIDLKELKPKRWHLWLLMIQGFSCALTAGVLLCVPMGELSKGFWEGMMVCLICPTATAAAVITGKLGGNAATLTTYTLLSNLLGAVMVPLVFPLVEPHEGLTFWVAFLKILSKVFPLLLAPFFVALFLKHYVRNVHRWLMEHSGMAFYIWAFALALVMGQTARSLINSDLSAWFVALGGLFTCAVQFLLGKRIGSVYHDRISAGQALGQKNTVLAIWMASAYLHPLATIAPGSYVLWQNIVNSYQLWKKRKKENLT
ncbi:MAG: transporter [Bacteroides sp.]|nr:transporter [Bacteroides sp.]